MTLSGTYATYAIFLKKICHYVMQPAIHAFTSKICKSGITSILYRSEEVIWQTARKPVKFTIFCPNSCHQIWDYITRYHLINSLNQWRAHLSYRSCIINHYKNTSSDTDQMSIRNMISALYAIILLWVLPDKNISVRQGVCTNPKSLSDIQKTYPEYI